jgi:hypothetical protein
MAQPEAVPADPAKRSPRGAPQAVTSAVLGAIFCPFTAGTGRPTLGLAARRAAPILPRET